MHLPIPRALSVAGVGLVVSAAALAPAEAATIVRFDTNLGAIDVELFDDDAPLNVANFLNYVRDGDYANTIIHRSVVAPVPFVIQGGGFTAAIPPVGIPTDPPVDNEFSVDRSNVRGTLAMAKLANDPDSATSQWFFNLADNSDNLDTQNGGFTVFGQIIDNGSFTVLDAIAAVPVYNAGSPFDSIPLINFSNTGPVAIDNFVLVQDIFVIPEPGTCVLGLAWLTSMAAWRSRR